MIMLPLHGQSTAAV